jgi:hypothetical protein
MEGTFMTTRAEYTQDAVVAARSVLLELVRLLGEYRDDIVVVGGWVPELLLPGAETAHTGSVDIDLALNHKKIQEAGYRTINRLLLERGYTSGEQPYVYFRSVELDGRTINVEVDLLAGEYEGTGHGRRTQKVQDVRPRKARGCDLAFDLYTEVVVEGALPGGGLDKGTIRVASIVPFLVMKGMALADRLKEKDAYDIYYCVLHFPGGIDALTEAFRLHASHGLVQEGLRKIGEKFASPQHTGPKHVADFLEIENAEERELLQRDAYERIHSVIERVTLS